MDDKQAGDVASALVQSGVAKVVTGVIGKVAVGTMGGTAVVAGTAAVGTGVSTAAGFLLAHTAVGPLTPVLVGIIGCNPIGLGVLAIGGVFFAIGRSRKN